MIQSRMDGLRAATVRTIALTLALLAVGLVSLVIAADSAGAQSVDGGEADLSLAFDQLDIDLAVQVRGADPGTPFPVAVLCRDGLSIDGGPATATRQVYASEPSTITVSWPDAEATFRCTVTTGWGASEPSLDSCDFRGRGDTFGISDGVIEFGREAGKDPRGAQLSITVACQPRDELLPAGTDVPLAVSVVPVGERFDEILPVRLRCPGAVVDGFPEVRTFFVAAGETVTPTVRWPDDLPRLRCMVSQRLKKSGHDDGFSYLARGDSSEVNNGIVALSSRESVAIGGEQMWVLTSRRGADVAEQAVGMRIEVDAVRPDDAKGQPTAFPIAVSCRSGLRIDGGVSKRTFFVSPGESLDLSVTWPEWKQLFNCQVQPQLAQFGMEQMWQLDSYENGLTGSEARVVSSTKRSELFASDTTIKMRFRSYPEGGRVIALNVEKLVVADDDGSQFPVTIDCAPGIGIDGGTTTKTFNLRHGERASFSIVWPHYVDTLRCAASERLEGTGLEAFWELDSVRDDFHNPFNGRIQTTMYGDPELDGRTFTVMNRPIPDAFRAVPMSVTKQVVAGVDDTVFPVTIECNPGIAIDGARSIKVFDLKAGETADFMVRWPSYVEQFRCEAHEDLSGAGLGDAWVLDDVVDSYENTSNGRVLTRVRTADIDGSEFTVWNRPVDDDARDIPMSVTKEVVSGADGTVFPVEIVCAPGLGIDGASRRKTFELRAGESAEFVVSWPSYVEEFRCDVHEDLERAGLSLDWLLKSVGDTYGNPNNGRVLATKRDAAIDHAAFTVVNAPTLNGVRDVGACAGTDIVRLMNVDGHHTSGIFPEAFAPGSYEVIVVSRDPGHRAGYQVDQVDERWSLRFLGPDDNVLAETALSPDLADDLVEDEWLLDDVELPAGIVAMQFALYEDAVTAASIEPYCVSLRAKSGA